MVEGKRCARSRAPWLELRASHPPPSPSRRPLKAQLQAELASATDAQAEEIRAEFDAREKAFEHSLDHEQRDVHMMIQCSYSTRRPRRAAPRPPCRCAYPLPSHRFPVQVSGRRPEAARPRGGAGAGEEVAA